MTPPVNGTLNVVDLSTLPFQRFNAALTFGDMSCAKIDPALHQAQKPPWIKVRLPSNPVFFSTKALISDLRLHTVCESAQCPNRWECWSQGTATMMIAGDRCTRACGFCAVTTAKPLALEEDEPQRRRSGATIEVETCRYYRGGARRS